MITISIIRDNFRGFFSVPRGKTVKDLLEDPVLVVPGISGEGIQAEINGVIQHGSVELLDGDVVYLAPHHLESDGGVKGGTE